VELDKKWETSAVRFFSLAVITYVTMNLILWTIGASSPALHAIIPTCGYMLSTLTLSKIKAYWAK